MRYQTEAWIRQFHFSPSALMSVDFDLIKPAGWWFASKTIVRVRPLPAPWKELDVIVEGVSEPADLQVGG